MTMQMPHATTANGRPSGIGVSLAELIGLREEARRLDIAPRGKVLATRSGGHLSRFRGRGMEFDESRLYVPGDNPRNMDWRVTARTGKAYVKRFREERERPVWLMVDLGPSMRFGTRTAFKSVIAAKGAALLAWAAAEKGDRIGGLIFDETRHFERPPAPRTRGLLPLLNALAQQPLPGKAGGHPNLTSAAEHLTRLVRPGSLVFLLSDFYGVSPDNATWMARLSEHSEVVIAEVVDPIEMITPPAGRYPITDGVRRSILDITRQAQRQAYHQQFVDRSEQLTELTRRYRAHLLTLYTHQPIGPALHEGLRPRIGSTGRHGEVR
ncbi:MAG: DUF58 domain-containing protein [Candidatus Thiodiazotropha sp.]